MIIFDFEWNRGYDKKPLDEILQIGAVRVDRLGGPVTDTFNVYIRPVVHKKFDPGAKKTARARSIPAQPGGFSHCHGVLPHLVRDGDGVCRVGER